MQIFVRILAVVLLAYSSVLMSEDLSLTNSYPDLEKVASKRAWLKLNYYRHNKSDIDDAEFFTAKQGRVSPEFELKALLSLMKRDPVDESIWCRFPARTKWLAREFDMEIPERAYSVGQHCELYRRWLNEARASSVSVIFPAAYLDSPSSMFGHTLLRFDKPKQEDPHGVLSTSVSYAAEKKPEDSELGFVYRGLVGGYPGVTSIQPYYLKIKEYNDIESRDIWEYEINFNSDEIAILLDHVWEIQGVNIDYYFFSQNCSYRVLSMLEAARPSLELTSSYNLYTIPVDTIKSLYHADLVQRENFRASAATVLNDQLVQLDELARRSVFEIAKGVTAPERITGTDERKRNVLDTAYNFSRMQSENGDTSFRILAARNQVPGANTLRSVALPKIRADEGHESSRVGIQYALESDSSQQTTSLSWRPAYHDLLDPLAGYPSGSELAFFDARVDITENNVQLDGVDVISIKSFKARNNFFKRWSWDVAIALDRDGVSSNQRLEPNVHGLLGPAYSIGDVVMYGLIGGHWYFHHDYEYLNDISLATELGLFYQSEHWQWRIFQHMQKSVNGDGYKSQLTVGVAKPMTQDLSFRLNYKNTIDDVDTGAEISFGLYHYF